MTDIGRPEPPERGVLGRITVDTRPPRTSRDFRRLWFGTGISAIGSQIDTIAMIFGMPRAVFQAFAEELGGGAGLPRAHVLGDFVRCARRVAHVGLG